VSRIHEPEKINDPHWGEETVVHLADGCQIRTGPGEYHEAGEYVRILDQVGTELHYWHHEEWIADPVSVMGAILNCAAGSRI
jgi:hypothetical protein